MLWLNVGLPVFRIASSSSGLQPAGHHKSGFLTIRLCLTMFSPTFSLTGVPVIAGSIFFPLIQTETGIVQSARPKMYVVTSTCQVLSSSGIVFVWI